MKLIKSKVVIKVRKGTLDRAAKKERRSKINGSNKMKK